MNISENCVASFNYILTDSNGKLLDSSEGHGPLSYLHGAGNIIPGLESALEGKTVGDKFTVTIPAADAYGIRVEEMQYDDDGEEIGIVDPLVQELPMSMFSGVDKIEVGMEFHAETAHGIQSVTVTKVEGDKVTIDGNHPLAGMDLTFAVEITEVRSATEEEMQHGHAHGAGGHHH